MEGRNQADSRLNALASRGVKFRKSGEWARIQAAWRDGDGYNVAISIASGWWKDHATGERGDWAELCRRLAMDPGAIAPLTAEQRQAGNAKHEQDTSRRVGVAQRLLSHATPDAYAFTTAPIEAQAEALAAAQRVKMAGLATGQRLQNRAKYLTVEELRGGLEYLASRGATEFAAAAGALVGRRSFTDDETGKVPAGWEIRWPIRVDGTAEIIGVQREAGRGHANKKMLGRKRGGGLIVHRRGGEQGGIVAIGEGAMTVRAVWQHYDCWGWIKYDAGNLADIDGNLFRNFKASEIWILADHDPVAKPGKGPGRAGQRAAQAAAERIKLVRPDLVVKIALPPIEEQDWDDVERQHQHDPAAFRAIFAASLRDPAPVAADQAEADDASPAAGIIKPSRWAKKTNAPLDLAPFWRSKPAEAASIVKEAKALGLAEATAQLDAVITSALERRKHSTANATPQIIGGKVGLGKTSAVTRYYGREIDHAGALILTPRLADVAAIAKAINDRRGPHAPQVHVHESRNAKNCQQIKEVSELAKVKRSPMAWLCETCPYGKAALGEERCGYMRKLEASLGADLVVASHESAAEKSTLYNVRLATREGDEYTAKRAMIVDEKIERVRRLDITKADLDLALMMLEPSLETVARRIERLTTLAEEAAEDGDAEQEKSIRADIKRAGAALDWIAAVKPELEKLARHLASIPAEQMRLKKSLSKTDWPELAELLGDIPSGARIHDGTELENVNTARAARLDLPRTWLKSLGEAMTEDTAYIRGGKIVGGHASTLWREALAANAIMLDATPETRAVEEVKAAGGSVQMIDVVTPNLKVRQIGPKLYGRSYLNEAEIKRRVDEITRAILAEQVGDVAVITHKPVADQVRKTLPEAYTKYIGHWGKDEKAHNDWRECRKLIIHGLPAANGDEAEISYAIDRAALLKAGRADFAEWHGTVERDLWLPIPLACDPSQITELKSRLPLADVPAARAWQLDQMAALVAQAIGRLRAVQRPDEALEVVIYGCVPLTGHGIQIDELALDATSAEAKSMTATSRVAEAVKVLESEGERATRKAISLKVQELTGIRASNATITETLAAMKEAALAAGVTLEAMAEGVTEFVADQYRRSSGPLGGWAAMAGDFGVFERISSGPAKPAWRARRLLAAVVIEARRAADAAHKMTADPAAAAAA